VQPDVGLSVFSRAPYINAVAFPTHDRLLKAEAIGSAQAVIVRTPYVTAESLQNSENLLAIGRFGVGYDSVDVAACRDADVMAFITPGAVDRSVAEATLTWMLALSHNVRVKDRLVREGEWQLSRYHIGCEIRDRTLGIVGLGRIGRAVAAMTRGLGMNQPIAFDPAIEPQVAAELGVRLAPLDELLSEADFVSLHCPLNDSTRKLIGRRELGLMKREAYLINIARGGIVDEDALYDALKAGRIAGAALDCFAGEPLTAPSRFGEFENVLLAPHSIAVTREHGRDIGRAVCQAILDLTKRKVPDGVVNPEVLERPGFQAKWKRLTEELKR
jgi:phosphoglycerate dehydrogenase-like enzyme